jgi:hypothetical protein
MPDFTVQGPASFTVHAPDDAEYITLKIALDKPGKVTITIPPITPVDDDQSPIA